MSEEPGQVFTHLVASDTEYYLSGPQQAHPPEGKLPRVTKVTLLEVADGYCRIRSEGGIEVNVSTIACSLQNTKNRKLLEASE